MDYRTILIHMDAGSRSAERLELAFALADRHDAHLVGLFALSAMHVPSYIRADSSQLLVAEQARQRAEAAGRAEAAFRAAAARYGGAKAEWRVSHDDALDAVRLNARYSDLVVVGQREQDAERDTGIANGFVDELTLSCGRPVPGGIPGRPRRGARCRRRAVPRAPRREGGRVDVRQPRHRHRGADPHARGRPVRRSHRDGRVRALARARARPRRRDADDARVDDRSRADVAVSRCARP